MKLALKAKQTPVVAVQNAVTSKPEAKDTTVYTVIAPKRPLTGVKYGMQGNAFTHAKLAEAAAASKTGTLTATEAMKVCKEANHTGFYSYAVNRLKILVAVKQV